MIVAIPVSSIGQHGSAIVGSVVQQIGHASASGLMHLLQTHSYLMLSSNGLECCSLLVQPLLAAVWCCVSSIGLATGKVWNLLSPQLHPQVKCVNPCEHGSTLTVFSSSFSGTFVLQSCGVIIPTCGKWIIGAESQSAADSDPWAFWPELLSQLASSSDSKRN